MITKYFIWYVKIIQNANSRQPTGYTEIHHILPRSMGGSNRKENLVRLTAREHFICHLLLTKLTTGVYKRKMSQAFLLMCPREKKYSRVYKEAKEIHSEYMSSKMKGIPKTEEHKNKIRDSNTGLKRTEETKKLLSQNQKERIQQSDYVNPFQGEKGSIMSTKNNLKRVKEGTNPWAGEKGSAHAKKVVANQLQNGIHPFQGEQGKELAIRRNKEAIKNGTHINCKTFTCPHCNLTGKGPNMLRWHFEKCKDKNLNPIDL